MRARIVSYEGPGVILRKRFGQPFTIAYGEILTAERLRSDRGVRLHTRTFGDVTVVGRGARARETEDCLRKHGVRIVDCWGAIVAPSLSVFEDELAREPMRVRQSSDDA
jgi:hypothetical protein